MRFAQYFSGRGNQPVGVGALGFVLVRSGNNQYGPYALQRTPIERSMRATSHGINLHSPLLLGVSLSGNGSTREVQGSLELDALTRFAQGSNK